jgi:hypothetical protein
VPGDRTFIFVGDPGTEKVFIILSRQPEQVTGPLISSQDGLYSRDLIIEKVDGPETEELKAISIVNQPVQNALGTALGIRHLLSC